MQKKKILILIDWFAPGYKAGGPIQSCVNLAFLLKQDFEIYVLTTDTDHGETEPYKNIVADQWITNLDPDIHIFYARKSNLNLKELREKIKEVNAEFIYLNHLFSPFFVVYPLWLKYINRLPGKVIVCPRGALYESALSVKSFKKKIFLSLFYWMRMNRRIVFHATNNREKEAVLRHFPGSTIVVADNLPSNRQEPFKNCKKEKGILKCIFIARIVPIKNLLFLLNILDNIDKQVELSVIGPAEDKAYWKKCEEKIAGFSSNISVRYLGAKQNEELIHFIRQHHLFILPTTGENFGHSIFEALLSGRPVLISDQTPWLKLDQKNAGWDIPLTEPGRFARVISEFAEFDQAEFDKWAMGAWKYAQTFITNPEIHKKYLQLFS